MELPQGMSWPKQGPALDAGWEQGADGGETALQARVGGATSTEFRWACSVVHSRTFGNAAKTGGVGVRMLVSAWGVRGVLYAMLLLLL